MTESSLDGAPRRRKFTEQYRRDAVELWRTSGRSASEIAKQLGIRADLLYTWGSKARPPGAAAPARSPEELARENAALREEVERLREQRDILKKSLGILSEPPLRGLPKSKP
jgi:transposase